MVSGKTVAPLRRDPGSIIHELATSAKNMAMGKSDWYCCRLMAKPPKIPPSIPDGASGKHICVCLYSIDRLSFGGVAAAKTASIRLVPQLPAPLLISGTDVLVNGNAAPPFTGGNYYAAGVAPQWIGANVTATRPGQTVTTNTYNSSTGRFVSIGLRIRYTGPVNTCAGSIRAWEDDLNLTDMGQTSATGPPAPLPTTGTFLTTLNAAGTVTAVAPLNTTYMLIDGNPAANPTAQTFTVRPEQGLAVRLKHRSAIFQSIDVRENFIGSSISTATTGSASFNIINANIDSGQFGGGILAFDNDWVGHAIRLDNVNSDASYSLETCVCFEFVPSSNSNFAPLAKDSPKAAPPSVLKKPDETLTREGAAVPLVNADLISA